MLETLNINLTAILPEILLTALALCVMALDLIMRRGASRLVLGYLSIIGLLIILPVSCVSVIDGAFYGGMVKADGFSAYFNAIFIIAAIFTILISMDYLKRVNINKGEYYYIVLFATLGMMVMAASNDLVNLYVGLELMALSFYVLVAIRTASSKSVEAALKYFVLGALSSGVLLYGISFTYGVAGTTNFTEIAFQARRVTILDPYLLLAIVFIIVGFSFKIALFPFHLWSPDTYEGAPTPIAALLSVGSKAAAFAAFMRVFLVALPVYQPHWSRIFWGLSAATMLYGSVVAISQKNIVRMLAYSSIAHAGIIMIGFLVTSDMGAAGVMYYLLVYAFMNIGAFTVVTLFIRSSGRGESIRDYRGLAVRHPWLAFVMSIFLVSLAGIPPTGGFTAKFFILSSAINAQYYWLAVIGVVSTAISLFFYAKVIFYMYLSEPDALTEGTAGGAAGGADRDLPIMSSATCNIVLVAAAVGTVLLGIYPTPFIDMAIKAVKPFFLT
ncbi:MAG: NADH-quinone oxidoreductase subunit N [Deltaproteobacteria bacterium]|nr:NADH-quinone oxidoreductase subunit N [Deltaproteobacteria bacterium]